jgi:uncharacterized protein (UPF0332 family)
MKFDWSKYLSLSQDLANDVAASLVQRSASQNQTFDSSVCEAQLRSSISRAYYAVFCLARNHLRDVDGDLTVARRRDYRINIHEYVIKEFQDSSDSNRKKVGICLKRLRDDRNQADYEDMVAFNILQAKSKGALSTATQVINLLGNLK